MELTVSNAMALNITDSALTRQDVDQQCKRCDVGTSGCHEKGFQFSILYRIGGYISLRSFVLSIDTDWFGNLDHGADAVPGLWWSRSLYKTCWEQPTGWTTLTEGVKDFVHDLIHGVQVPVAGAVHKIGEKMAELGSGKDDGE